METFSSAPNFPFNLQPKIQRYFILSPISDLKVKSKLNQVTFFKLFPLPFLSHSNKQYQLLRFGLFSIPKRIIIRRNIFQISGSCYHKKQKGKIKVEKESINAIWRYFSINHTANYSLSSTFLICATWKKSQIRSSRPSLICVCFNFKLVFCYRIFFMTEKGNLIHLKWAQYKHN